MSLYEGILDDAAIVSPSFPAPNQVGQKRTSQDADEDGISPPHGITVISDAPRAPSRPTPSWNGMKMLQTHIQLKKPSTTATPQKTHVAPVVDLSARTRSREHKQGLNMPPVNVLRARKAQPLDDSTPPLSFIPRAMKEDKVWLFGEVLIEDEYNPLVPNDFEQCRKKREERRVKERAARDVAERLAKEHDDEFSKRRAGAAIAPPPTLTDSTPLDDPSLPSSSRALPPAFTPSFGSGRGLGVAARIMSSMGYREGAGLGRQGQGISTALKVESVGRGSGKIIHEQEQTIKAVGEQAAGSYEALKSATRILLLRNMVGVEDLDDDLEPEIRSEMNKYGQVSNVVVFQMPQVDLDPEEAVRVFVEFTNVAQAIKAFVDLNGRFFGGRAIRAAFYSFDAYSTMDYKL